MKALKVLLAVAILAFAFAGAKVLLWGGDDFAKQINILAERASSLPESKEDKAKREASVGEIIGEYLTISSKSNDYAVKSTAFLGAALVALNEFERAEKEFEAQEAKLYPQRPDASRLTSAIAYLTEAARICPPGSAGCYSQLIQRNLDYASGLLSKLPRGESTIPQTEPFDQENKDSGERGGEKGKKVKDKPIDGSVADGSDQDSESMQEGEAHKPMPLKGSVRGARSREPVYTENGYPGAYSGGSYQENVNKP